MSLAPLEKKKKTFSRRFGNDESSDESCCRVNEVYLRGKLTAVICEA